MDRHRDSFVRFDYTPENLHPYKLPCFVDVGPEDLPILGQIRSKVYNEFFDLWAEFIGIELLPKVMFYKGELMNEEDSKIVWKEYHRWYHEGMEQEEGYHDTLEATLLMHPWNSPDILNPAYCRVFINPVCTCDFLIPLKHHLTKKVNTKGSELINKPEKDIAKGLIQLMKGGAEEFKAETGRDMTYSEMRDMWG